MTPTAVPSPNDVTASARCTQKYAVGSPAASNARPLASRNKLRTNVIQMNHDHTPKASRNTETPRLSFMRPVSGPRLTGPSRARDGRSPVTHRTGPNAT
ncbi:DUF5136 domain-containing protein [Glycomyces sp. NEAU-7082]|uniref:DUF5136 domain-containing protein n=1 Tax=Glycomyces albidus TaxID=2656774 RepID=A0A6L5GE82_9ACTN|nr:DUF5136 domain-containing protein [Glycomyces albidus]